MPILRLHDLFGLRTAICSSPNVLFCRFALTGLGDETVCDHLLKLGVDTCPIDFAIIAVDSQFGANCVLGVLNHFGATLAHLGKIPEHHHVFDVVHPDQPHKHGLLTRPTLINPVE